MSSADRDQGGKPRRRPLAAFHHRNYRYYFPVMLIASIGSFMYGPAVGFLGFEMTRSPAFLGWLSLASGMPTVLLCLYGGVVADRLSRRHLIAGTSIFCAAMSALLALVTFTHLVQPWHLIALAVVSGIVGAFSSPVFIAFVADLVDRASLTSAVALNWIGVTIGMTLGPGLSGVIYSAAGPGWCFAIDALAPVPLALVALLVLRPSPQQVPAAPSRGGSAWQQVTAGLRFAVKDRVVGPSLLLDFISSFFLMSTAAVGPVWAVDVLRGDARVNGLLGSVVGLGGVLGGLVVAVLGSPRIGRAVFAAHFLVSVSTAATGAQSQLATSLVLFSVSGFLFVVARSLNRSVQQLRTPDALRGRVMGVAMLVGAGVPLGGLSAGLVTVRLGVQSLMVINGGLALVLSAALALFCAELRLFGEKSDN